MSQPKDKIREHRAAEIARWKEVVNRHRSESHGWYLYVHSDPEFTAELKLTELPLEAIALLTEYLKNREN